MVTVNVNDFKIDASPNPVNVFQGSTNTTTVNVTALGGFTGVVAVTVQAPSGITATPASFSITISGSQMLTIATGPGTSTPLGTYLVNVTGTSAGLPHAVTVTVNVVQSVQCNNCLPPELVQANFHHRLSLSKTGGVQTYKIGVLNPNSALTIYVNVQVVATDGAGVAGFTLNTGVITLSPSQTITNQLLSITLPASDLGSTFTWTLSVQWGTTATTDPAQLPFNTFTDTGGIPTSGSFTVIP
jgi:hypothetical protein